MASPSVAPTVVTAPLDENLGTLALSHIIVIAAVYTVVVVIILCLVARRWAQKRTRLRGIPRGIMPFLRPGDLSTKQRKHIVNRLVTSSETSVNPQVNEEDHLGYGIHIGEDGEKRQIHFKTSIATSHRLIEAAAMYKDPRLRRKTSMTVRDYIFLLKKNTEGLSRKLCIFYIENYERARFSEEEFTLAEYTAFMENLREILEAFATPVATIPLMKSHLLDESNPSTPISPKKPKRGLARVLMEEEKLSAEEQ
eukprot:TRINITY_DN4706_c0_g1_i4.p1 TRINITY_DN4706_c0_g1~~TRINITY_DN4706_c0_g1_i4.p1  ORF type:complete len:253 (+),score=55.42 TRINITY_DN4706_c0_g1_i4:689-1447(+)